MTASKAAATLKNIDGASEFPVYIVLGSGGHTAEMCQINQALLASNNGKTNYIPARYIVARTDTTSRKKLETAGIIGMDTENDIFIEVPRSREVGQSWLTTIFSTLWALLWSFWLVFRDRPRLLLCNGPGTCVPFCVATFLWRLLGRLPQSTKIVFVESFCRVRTLSLSGRLLLPIADVVVVQWPTLAEKYQHRSNVKYFGRIM